MAESDSCGAVNVEQRMCQIFGKPPRVRLADQIDLDDDQIDIINGILEITGTKDVPPFFLLAMRHPQLLNWQLATGKMFYPGNLPMRERELVVLRTSWLCGAPNEWGEHVVIGRKFSLTDEDIDNIKLGPEALSWTEHERAVISAVDELLSDYMISDASWDILSKTWDDIQLMEFPLLVSVYFGAAIQQNSLRMPMSKENRGLRAK